METHCTAALGKLDENVERSDRLKKKLASRRQFAPLTRAIESFGNRVGAARVVGFVRSSESSHEANVATDWSFGTTTWWEQRDLTALEHQSIKQIYF